ncbi:MAG TPA: sigma-70 family RNA polymerase sigma factor [Gemmatimonadaceae bacterium]
MPPASVPSPQRVTDQSRNPPDERILTAAAQRGDQAAFGMLVRLHSKRAYAVARAIVTVHEDAEDAVQEAFVRAYQALDRFNLDQAFGPWLNRIVANAALDLARRRKVRTTDELHESLAGTFRDPGEADELRRRLAEALAKLPDRMRSVLVLHDIEGFAHSEIGKTLGIPEGTARSDLHHARQRLRGMLRDLRND